MLIVINIIIIFMYVYVLLLLVWSAVFCYKHLKKLKFKVSDLVIETRNKLLSPAASFSSSSKMTDFIRNNLRENLHNLKSTANLRLPSIQPASQLPNNNNNNNNNISSDEVDNREFPRADYRLESVRLQSYTNWPLSFMDPAKLAAAGFYYTGHNDDAKCFECGIVIREWVEGDNPMSDHQRWQSNCRFVRKLPCGNVPIGVDPSTVPSVSPRSRDVCGRYGDEFRPDASPDFRSGQTEFQFPSSAKLGSQNLAQPKGPAHPEFASYDARLKSFESWPKSMPQTKDQLADAGFYYTGTGDQTICYHCGGGLNDWEPKDDPWFQHAKWFKKCYYVLMVKGQDFIKSVIGQPVAPPSREETMQMNLSSYIEKLKPPASIEKPEEEPEKKPEAEVKPVNKNADDARMCKICYNDVLGVVFLPCRHMVACTRCAASMTSCPVCREPVSMTVRAIIS
ncbi:baculoviral IAP repeat-containing protein 7-B-like isoform X2 [Cotesia glomerata]|uniref:baculoviral IAP repeat-containing protein 7-B-like isoform X2 n=1 Tax=Cotesia glomerata TaxID=32391 RepID=UPI001D026CD4|nr:baculoviral IAP repeat-containing protein 7-B-like isoform X2 [Cotesia glomerata]